MGCRSDYMNPTEVEKNRKEVAAHLCFVHEKLAFQSPVELSKAAADTYGANLDLEKYVPQLCTMLTNLTAEQKDDIIYDGRDVRSRKLADWWDEHQEADRKRLEAEETKRLLIKIKEINGEREYNHKHLTCVQIKKDVNLNDWANENVVSSFYADATSLENQTSDGGYWFGGEVFLQLISVTVLTEHQYETLQKLL